jgi:nucleotide-binding universal stress UspA family protein
MTRVLVPVAVLDGETVSAGLMNLLGTVDVTVLGYHVLPEQTPPDQARLQFEERATSALEDLSEEFRTAGGAADHRLVFTRDRTQTVERVADEIDASALAISGVTGGVDRILVPLSGDIDVDSVLTFVTELVGDRDIGVTLFAAGEAADAATDRLDTAAETLRSRGLSVETRAATGTDPFTALADEIPGHDAIAMGEQAPSFRSLVFGEESKRVASASVGPVLVVRNDETPSE